MTSHVCQRVVTRGRYVFYFGIYKRRAFRIITVTSWPPFCKLDHCDAKKPNFSFDLFLLDSLLFYSAFQN